MRAVVLQDSRVIYRSDYPEPDIAASPPGEALVRVHRAGICNTDLELISGYAGFQGVLGHEFVGVVEACASQPEWEGQRIVGEINAACGVCPTCRAGRRTHCPARTALGIRGRDGAFADLLTLPAVNLHAVPPGVSDDQAVFVEPLAAALAVTDQIHIRPTDRVVVLGDGKLGQLVAQVLALSGCNLTVLGRHAEKLHLLAGWGIDTTTDDLALLAREADVVVEATGTPGGFATAQRLVRARGTLVLKSTYHGTPAVDLSTIVVDELHVIGSRCGPFKPALSLLERGLVRVEPMIQARYPLHEGVAALERAGQRGTLKVLLDIAD